MLNKIAKILRATENLQCLKKAHDLEVDESNTKTLSLRDLGLKPIDIAAIAGTIAHEKDNNTIKSISFSHNNLIGDTGASMIIKSLPYSINEIGLVDCGIGDKGGYEILNWLKTAHNLQMLCIEHNNFSDQLKMKFKDFKTNNPKILFVF
jgi:hypothetical protein